MNPLSALLSVGLGLLMTGAVWAAADQRSEAGVLAGRALYRGAAGFAKPPQLQGVALPGTACSQCHGLRGEARDEAGIRVPPIQWAALLQGRDALTGYVDAQRVTRAIGRGEGRQGRSLQAPMPQFQMTPQEQRALVAYLQVLGTDAEPIPGVTAKRVVVATVLPLSGPQAGAGHLVKTAMAERFAAINAQGGVFGRQIAWRAIDGGPNVASASKAARAALLDDGAAVFAFVGSLLPEPDGALLQLLKSRGVSMVATLGVAQSEPTQPEVTYLLPSLAVQLRELAAEMGRRCGVRSETPVVLHPAGGGVQAAMQGALPDGKMQPVSSVSPWAATERPEGAGQVIALLGGPQMAQLREHLSAGKNASCLGSLAVISGRPPSVASERYIEAVALPMPPVVQDSAQAAGAALWSVLGDTAARVFAEALARSGRGLDAERFALALDSLRQFQPIPGLSVTYGPQQRHAFDVTYLWRENQHETPHTVP